MNKNELKIKLEELKVPKYLFSLDGEEVFDRLILQSIHNVKWEVFYLDDRGKKENMKIFFDENSACEYMFSEILDAITVAKKFDLNT